MVETKTQKRKAAARTVAKALHENSKVEAAKKAALSPTGVSPVTARTRSKLRGKQPLLSTVVSEEKKRGASDSSDKPKESNKVVDAGSKAKPSAKLDAAKHDIGSESDEDEFASQRLVVQLSDTQEKRLEEGLKKIKSDKGIKPNSSAASVDGKTARKSSVIYLGRIPYGFFENQMRAYFGQFGEILRLRLSRNKKTAKSKHYAFIEFAHPEVADIVAETHNNMLMCDRMIKCNVVPVEKVLPSMWQGSDRAFKPIPFKAIAMKRANRKRTPEDSKKRVDKLVTKEKAKRKRLEALGIEYDFGGYEQLRDASRPKRTKF